MIPSHTVGDALRALARAGRIASPWLPGMQVLLDRGRFGGVIPFRRFGHDQWIFPSEVTTSNRLIDAGAEVDLDDPATVGLLLVQLRSALGLPYLAVVWSPHIGWGVYNGSELLFANQPDHAKEARAVAAALIAVAAELGAP
ncbi:MAG: hypothetical protein ABMA64_07025 [Myxococcota bacterium]